MKLDKVGPENCLWGAKLGGMRVTLNADGDYFATRIIRVPSRETSSSVYHKYRRIHWLQGSQDHNLPCTIILLVSHNPKPPTSERPQGLRNENLFHQGYGTLRERWADTEGAFRFARGLG